MTTGIAVGLNKGKQTTALPKSTKQANQKGRVTKHGKFVRSLVREVTGFAPYERRIMELLKNSKDKRARRLAKKRLGTMRRAKKKVEEMGTAVSEMRRAADKKA